MVNTKDTAIAKFVFGLKVRRERIRQHFVSGPGANENNLQ